MIYTILATIVTITLCLCSIALTASYIYRKHLELSHYGIKGNLNIIDTTADDYEDVYQNEVDKPTVKSSHFTEINIKEALEEGYDFTDNSGQAA